MGVAIRTLCEKVNSHLSKYGINLIQKNTIIQTHVTVLHDNNLVKMLCKIIKIVKITFCVVVISYCLVVECGRVKRVVGGAAVECGNNVHYDTLRCQDSHSNHKLKS